MEIFDEVICYERFRKNKIVEFSGFEKSSSDVINNINMDENDLSD